MRSERRQDQYHHNSIPNLRAAESQQHSILPPTSQLGSGVVSSVSPTKHSLPEIIWQNLPPWDTGMHEAYQDECSFQKLTWLLEAALMWGDSEQPG